jgi:hypothetical protein
MNILKLFLILGIKYIKFIKKNLIKKYYMDTSINKQLQFLVQEHTGVKLEKTIEQILESNLYNTKDLLDSKNVLAVR